MRVNPIASNYRAAVTMALVPLGPGVIGAPSSLPSLGKIAKDMAAFTIIDSFLDAQRRCGPIPFWPGPFETYARVGGKDGGWAIVRAAQSQIVATLIDIIG